MPAFAEPWEARAFAMVRALQDAGLLTSAEWTAALAAQDSTAAGDTSYHQWLSALESVVATKNLASTDTLSARRAAWARAARRTPHGDPIELRPDDFDG